LDIIAHALWTTVAGIAARRRLKRPIRLSRAAAWGVFPDLAAFAIPAAVKIWRVLTGAAKSLLPDGRGPSFDWVWGVYNCTHSALVFALCFGAAWLLLRRPVLEMLGWGLHIAIDIFTHSGLFAIRILWPLSPVCFDGIRWETPWLMAANYAALGSIYAVLWLRRASWRATARGASG
jgi:hypothetical protein